MGRSPSHLTSVTARGVDELAGKAVFERMP